MVGSTVPVGCGQCSLCRINRRRVWTARQVLESFTHGDNCFITLTYADEHIPKGGNLDPEDLRNFYKRLRVMLDRKGQPKIRHFSCGEYGDRSWRPHYHASVFGLSELHHHLVEAAWMKGFVYTAEFNRKTAQYVAGYVVKGMTQDGHPKLGGRTPEFVRMSNGGGKSVDGGIGAKAMLVLAETLISSMPETEEDVPMAVRMDGKLWPLGRYLREKLRKELHVTEEEKHRIKQRFFTEKSNEVCFLLDRSIRDGEALSASEILAREAVQKVRNAEARDRIFHQKGTL